MDIERCMKKTVQTVRPRDSILRAREIMEQHRINQLPVVVNGRLVGIVTDRDLRDAWPSAFEAPRHGRERGSAPDPKDVPVDAVMSQNVLTLRPGDSMAAAARLMRRERIGAIPILGEDDRLIGIVARADVLEAFVEQADRFGDGVAARAG